MLKNLIKPLLIISITATSCGAFGNYQDFSALLPKGSQMALVILDQQGHVVEEYNGQQMMLPASTLKVVTATAAWLELGEQFRYSTTISTAKVKDGVANSDLLISMSGDPTLTRADLFRLVRQLKRQGVNTINGQIRFDNGLFQGYDRAAGWPWDDLGICFSAPISQVMLDGNCAKVSLKPAGKRLILNKQSHLPLDITADVSNAPTGPLCPLELEYTGRQYHVQGCADRAMSLSLAIDAPQQYVTDVLMQQLAEVGISLQGNEISEPSTDLISVSHLSKPLDKLLKRVLEDSDNQISDSLLRTLGQVHLGVGSFEAGVLAVKSILSKQLEIDLTSADIYDGSGLSRYNQISPMVLAQLLQRWQQPNLKPLISLLPVAGKSGTLKYRNSLKPLGEKVVAKTGSFRQVSNLAGFVTQGDQQLVAVLFVTGINASNNNAKQQVREFEQALFNCIAADCFNGGVK